MTNTISIKTQSKRATQWYEKKCVNINLFYKGFEFALVTSGHWGQFEEESPNVEITINGTEYRMPLEKFKTVIKKNCKK